MHQGLVIGVDGQCPLACQSGIGGVTRITSAAATEGNGVPVYANTPLLGEINDDDHVLTEYETWRVGAAFRYKHWVKAKAFYSDRVKIGREEFTLLQDVEASRLRGDLELAPSGWLTVGGGFAIREREYPTIEVSADGDKETRFRLTLPPVKNGTSQA